QGAGDRVHQFGAARLEVGFVEVAGRQVGDAEEQPPQHARLPGVVRVRDPVVEVRGADDDLQGEVLRGGLREVVPLTRLQPVARVQPLQVVQQLVDDPDVEETRPVVAAAHVDFAAGGRGFGEAVDAGEAPGRLLPGPLDVVLRGRVELGVAVDVDVRD